MPSPAGISPSPTILLPDLPPKTLVGVDLVSFTSTHQFHGIRDLPNGWHFLYTGTTESLSIRCGAWLYVGDINSIDGVEDAAAISGPYDSPSAEVFIWIWNPETETLTPLKGDNDNEKQQAMRLKANLGHVWQTGGLFRYRSRVSSSVTPAAGGDAGAAQDTYDEEDEDEGKREWAALTDRLSPRLFSRVVGRPEFDSDGRPRWVVTSASTARADTEHIPGISSPNRESASQGNQENEFTFLPIDLKRTWREGAIGRERTEAAQDRSWALGDLIDRYSDEMSGGTQQDKERSGEAQVLGELQFTFLMTLTLMNYSCLQQWKRLLGLLLTCRGAIQDREPFMASVLRLLLLQLKRSDDVEGGFFAIDTEEGDIFLRNYLTKFNRTVTELAVVADSNVKTEMAKLEDFVRKEYDWELQPQTFVRRGMVQLEDGEEIEMEMNDDENEETGEYAPLVVEFEEEKSRKTPI